MHRYPTRLRHTAHVSSEDLSSAFIPCVCEVDVPVSGDWDIDNGNDKHFYRLPEKQFAYMGPAKGQLINKNK